MRRVALGHAEVVLSGKREISARRLFAAIQQLEQAKAWLEVTEECPFVFILLTDNSGEQFILSSLEHHRPSSVCLNNTSKHPTTNLLALSSSKTAIALLDV